MRSMYRTFLFVLIFSHGFLIVPGWGHTAETVEETKSVDVAVVCPETFRAALQPWVAHRTGQGHRVAFLSNLQSQQQIKRQIQDLAKREKLQYVLLVGDDEPKSHLDQTLRKRCVPAKKIAAKVNIRWGSEPEIATDNDYADLDGDHAPDLAVGRISVDTAEQLNTVVRKILDYEKTGDFGFWRRRVEIVAGVGGFGTFTDKLLEMTAKRLITAGLPAEFSSRIAFASWQSPYCPDPRYFRSATLESLNRGSMFWVYMGHGNVRRLDLLRAPNAHYRILDARDIQHLDCESGQPIAFFMSCYCGAFDVAEDCLAEEMVRSRGGPIAAICGSRVTMPYAMSLLGTGLMDECFQHRSKTLGTAFLKAKRSMMVEGKKTETRRMIDSIAQAFHPEGNQLKAERLEHLALFNLLGDPLLRLAQPRKVAVNAPQQQNAGGTLQGDFTTPLAGKCTVELVTRRDLLRFSPSLRSSYDTSAAAQQERNQEFLKANNPVWCSQSLVVEPGRRAFRLEVPAEARGPCHVRIFVEGKDSFAVGAADIEIEP